MKDSGCFSFQRSIIRVTYQKEPSNGPRIGIIQAVHMTDMVYGSVPTASGEPVVSKWWRTIDKWTLLSIFILFSIGL